MLVVSYLVYRPNKNAMESTSVWGVSRYLALSGIYKDKRWKCAEV